MQSTQDEQSTRKAQLHEEDEGDVGYTTDKNAKPSTWTNHYWIYSINCTSNDTITNHDKVGKWMIFEPMDSIDKSWEIIRKATEEGILGQSSKVSTQRERSEDNKTGVICIYTNDWTDEQDVFRVRRELRKLGFTRKLPYKSDADTYAGIYRANGHKRISKYYA